MTAILISLLLAAAEPADIAPLLARAEVAVAQGDLQGAATVLDAALSVDPDDVDALYAAGNVARQLGRRDSVTLLSRLLKLDPNADEARLQLALARWEQGDAKGASEDLRRLLARHPELPEALEAQRLIDGGSFQAPSYWHPLGRIDMAAGYDSNLTLLATSVPSKQAVGVGLVDVAVGASYDTPSRPFSGFARLTTLQTMNDRSLAMPNAATVVGLGLVGRQYLGGVESVLDLRYDEVFTDSFSVHQERVIAPSLYGTLPFAAHRLRLLAGADLVRAASTELQDSTVGRLGVRDTFAAGRFLVQLDATGRRNWGQGAAPVAAGGVPSREIDFLELGLQGYAETALAADLSSFLVAGYAHRGFEGLASGTSDNTLSAQLGARYTLGWVELHAEYAFTHNASSRSAWTWSRHAIFAGVRVYTP